MSRHTPLVDAPAARRDRTRHRRGRASRPGRLSPARRRPPGRRARTGYRSGRPRWPRAPARPSTAGRLASSGGWVSGRARWPGARSRGSAPARAPGGRAGTCSVQPLSRKCRLSSPRIVGAAKLVNLAPRLGSKRSSAPMRPMRCHLDEIVDRLVGVAVAQRELAREGQVALDELAARAVVAVALVALDQLFIRDPAAGHGARRAHKPPVPGTRSCERGLLRHMRAVSARGDSHRPERRQVNGRSRI